MAFNSHTKWDDCADKYSEFDQYVTGPHAKHALDRAIRTMQHQHHPTTITPLTIGDIACGSGVLALHAASMTAAVVKQVYATDFSKDMIRVLNARAAPIQSTLSPMTTLVADATDLSAWQSGILDIAVGAFGVVFIPDAGAAYREMLRLTKTGGQVVLLSWTGAQQSQFHAVLSGMTRHANQATAKPDAAAANKSTATTGEQQQQQSVISNVLSTLPTNIEAMNKFCTNSGDYSVRVESSELHNELGMTYHSAKHFVDGLQGVSPVNTVGSKEFVDAQVQYITDVFGAHSQFVLNSTSIIAVVTKL